MNLLLSAVSDFTNDWVVCFVL